MTMARHIPANVWEPYGDDIQRMKVIGGWLVKHESFNNLKVIGDRGCPEPDNVVIIPTMTFIPDLEHRWDDWFGEDCAKVQLTSLINPGDTS